MIHLAGAVLLIGGGLLAGIMAEKEIKRKVKMLYSTIAALNEIRGEIAGCQTPLKEIFYRLSQQPGEQGRFFAALESTDEKPLRVRWEESVNRHLTKLSSESRDVLLNLGTGLGQSLAEEQIRLLEEALHRLEDIYTREAEQARSTAKLWKRICPGIAAAAAILLM